MNLKADNRRHASGGPARLTWRAIALALLAACALILALGAPSRGASGQAQEGVDPAADSAYSLWWRTIDGGGASFVSAGDYRLGGTAGQPDAAGRVSAGSYTLEGGFWVVAPGTYHVYLPIVPRNAP